MNNDPNVRTHVNDTEEHTVSTMTTHKGPPATGRTTRLKRVRNRTIDAIEQARTAQPEPSTWIDQHDAIVSAGLKALGYPPLPTPTNES